MYWLQYCIPLNGKYDRLPSAKVNINVLSSIWYLDKRIFHRIFRSLILESGLPGNLNHYSLQAKHPLNSSTTRPYVYLYMVLDLSFKYMAQNDRQLLKDYVPTIAILFALTFRIYRVKCSSSSLPWIYSEQILYYE